MKLSECEIGDIIKDGRRVMEFCGTTLDNKFACKVIESTYVAESNGILLIFSWDNGNFELVSRKSEKSLEQQIQEKEIELENLKTKLRESNVKKVLDNLDPNTIYKIVHDGFEEVGFVTKGFEYSTYTIYGINMKPIGTIPTKSISKIFPLKEATETYHKLQLLLKNS